MKNPLKKNESESTAFAKVLVNRNTFAEDRIKSYFGDVVEIANEWIIPLMKQLQIEVTFENVAEYVGEDIKSLFIDTLIMRKTNGAFVPPTKYKQLYGELEQDFETALNSVIANSPYIQRLKQENAQATAKYQDKVTECEKTLAEEEFIGNRGEKERAKKELPLNRSLLQRVTTDGVEYINNQIESRKQAFSFVSIDKNPLKSQKEWFKMVGETIAFDDEKIMRATAIYAETPKEVALIEKLRQLAALTNEIYGKEYPGPLRAFCTFFTTDNGKVVLKPDISKGAIEEYAKNI